MNIVLNIFFIYLVIRCGMAMYINHKFAKWAKENLTLRSMDLYLNWGTIYFIFVQHNLWTFKQVLKKENES